MRPFILVLALVPLLGGCVRTPEELAISGPAQGTTYSIKVASAPADVDAHALRVATEQVLNRIDLSMSTYRADSEISRFNASTSTDWFEVSADLATVVDYALQVSRVSDGMFDITVGPLVAAWGFGPAGEPIDLPDEAQLAELRAQVGYQRLEARLSPPALRKSDPRVRVDLNGIAPGYTVDLIAERFQRMHLGHFMIDLGGEVRAQGRNARGEAWRIAVERPIDAEPEPYAIVSLHNASVTTSGEYRHYYDRDGHRYSHTIDPRTGRPVEHTLASVVIIGPTTMYVDAWAKVFNVLGTEAGRKLALERAMPVMFIEAHVDARGTELHSVTTPQFETYLSDGK